MTIAELTDTQLGLRMTPSLIISHKIIPSFMLLKANYKA
jgi:hypothetical protein